MARKTSESHPQSKKQNEASSKYDLKTMDDRAAALHKAGSPNMPYYVKRGVYGISHDSTLKRKAARFSVRNQRKSR